MKYIIATLLTLLSIIQLGYARRSSLSPGDYDDADIPRIYPMKPTPEPYRESYSGIQSPLMRIKMRRGRNGRSSPFIFEETLDGYTLKPTINKGKLLFYTYLDIDSLTGELFDTKFVAGRDNPLLKKITKHAASKYQEKKEKKEMEKEQKKEQKKNKRARKLRGVHQEPKDQTYHDHRRTAITSGTLKNLVIPFRFSDHSSRSLPSRSDLDALMNNEGPAAPCPTGSVRDVYLKSSFNQLDIQSTVIDWVTIDVTEAYCANGNSGLTSQIHQCLTKALDQAVANGVNFGDFDVDNDGIIDSITFFHSGYGAEWGGVDAAGAASSDRIWSHKWAIFTTNWNSAGVRVYNYHINPSLWARSGANIGHIGVVAHETGHFLGVPDLYDSGDPVYGDGEGIGSWGLMANSWGFDGSQYYPPHMSAWTKYVLGWVTPTVVSSSGTYTLSQACDNDDMIMISKGFPSGEYLLIENRQPCGFETTMGQGGLAIFHIDSLANNILGHPDQAGWPENANHYKVALLQAEDSFGLERGVNRGDTGDLFRAGGVTSIGPGGTSAGGAYPNTKSYQGGIILDSGVTISNIGSSGETMSFDVSITEDKSSTSSEAPSISPSASSSASPSASSSASPSASPNQLQQCEDFPDPFIVLFEGGATKKKSCLGASDGSLCTQNGVNEICPLSCGTCSNIADTPLKFHLKVDGEVVAKQYCSWIALDPEVRCRVYPTAKLACRATCADDKINVPSVAPSTPPNQCLDFPNPFRVKINGVFQIETCDGAKLNGLCNWNGVKEICPLSCGTCSICADTKLRFWVTVKGEESDRACIWAERSPANRCGYPLVPLACRSTCNNCLK